MSTTTSTDREALKEATTTSTPPMTAAKWLRANRYRSGRWPSIALAMGTLSTLLLLAQAWAIATVAERLVIQHESLSSLMLPLAVLPVVFIARGLCARFKTVAGMRAGQALRQSVRAELLANIGQRSPLWVRHQHSATLNNRVWDDVDALNGYYADYLPQITLCGIIPFIILVVVFPLNWAAGLILLITGPMIPLNMAMVGMGAKNLQDAQIREMGRLSRHFLDTVRGLPTLKLFGLGKRQARSVERVSEDFRQRTMKVLKLAFLSSTALEFFSSVSIAILAIYIGFTYLGRFDFGTWDHGLNLATGLFILILAPEFYQPLRDLGTHYHAKAAAEAAAEGLLPLLNAPASEVPTDSPPQWQPQGPIALSFQHVSARYPQARERALEDLNVELKAGQTLAVIGPSGAGKSTLMNLLLGFMPLEHGNLCANDLDVRQLKHDDWRKTLAWVGQRSALIKGSVADNLRMAALDDVDDMILWQALEQAQLKDWVQDLPDGLDTAIGEGGQPVSGGQARRISLARAFVRKAPLTLLDEPTASLDVDSEAQVINGLAQLKQQSTLIMLTHRLELLKLADWILVLEHGKIAAQGDLETLSQPGGVLENRVSFVGDAQ